MKIAHVITGLNNGGAEAALYRLCYADSANKHIVISLMDAGNYGPLLKGEGIPVHCLQMPQGRVTLKGLWTLWRLLRSTNPDLVQTWMYHADLIGGVLARLAGIRKVCWGIHHTNLDSKTNKLSTRLIVWFCVLLSHWVPEKIISCSQQAVIVHQRLGYAQAKFVVVPNGYDLDQFQPTPEARIRLRREWNILSNTPLLGMVARFNPQKDHESLLKALAQLKVHGVVFRCMLVGPGIDTDNLILTKLIAAYDIADRVCLLGPRHDIHDVMNALDIHVLSSSIGEAFPNVLAEAMACGTPCVTTDVGDAALIVGDTGWVVPCANPLALHDAIGDALAAMDNHNAWLKRKSACRAHISHNFKIEQMQEKYQAIWKSITISQAATL